MSETEQYKCPSCGGALEFNGKAQKLKCSYCDSEFDVEVLNESAETDKKTEAEDKMEGWASKSEKARMTEEDSVCSYSCPSCGGEIIADANTGATVCPFCGNSAIIKEKFSDMLRPDLIIPFKLDKNAAKEAFTKHLSGKKLLPKLFKSETHVDEIKAVYVPFWLYDAEVDGAVKYSATDVRHWTSGNYRYTETKHYELYREGSLAFSDIPVDASSKMPDDLMDSLEPFRFDEAVDFNTAYFAGYSADKYDVSVDENIPRINARVKTSTENTFRNTIRHCYNTVSVKNSFVNLKNGNAKYALLPVWLLHTTWKGEKYTFAMNGQTGKFVGNLPMDKGLYRKYWFISFICAIPLGILAAFAIKFLLT